jgi:hypothetical protein
MNDRDYLGSGMDPSGRLYISKGQILRELELSQAEFYLSLLNKPEVNRMIGQQIVETRQGADNILEHRKISPINYCFEWPSIMLREAALLTLEICLHLNESGMVLKDATPWNILYEATHPIFVDFTSIYPQEKGLFWVAYDQFCRLFLFPLVIANLTSPKVTRSMLMASNSGVTHGEMVQLLSISSVLRKPWLLKRLYLPSLLVRLLQSTKQSQQLIQESRNVEITTAARKIFFSDLRQDILSIEFSTGKSYWSQYYQDIDSFIEPAKFHQKQKTVAALLEQIKPATVVDIGCNQGGYSILAALRGSKVIAFDTDEDSIASLYQLSKQKNLSVLPLVMDAIYSSPQCGWRGVQYPSAVERFKSELALALALVHHLAITQSQSFERIVQILSDYSTKWLITEFVPLDDDRSQEISMTNKRDLSWYTLDGFLQALGKHYKRIETLPSYPEKRVLCICEK